MFVLGVLMACYFFIFLKWWKVKRQFFVKTLSGETLTLDLNLRSVAALRRAIVHRTGCVISFRLHCMGKELQHDRDLQSYNVLEGSTIFMLARLMGGPHTLNDFKFASDQFPSLINPTACRNLVKIPGMSSPQIASKIFNQLKDGSFSVKAWYDNLSTRIIANLAKKGVKIYWGPESVIDGVYKCDDCIDLTDEIPTTESEPDMMEVSQISYLCTIISSAVL